MPSYPRYPNSSSAALLTAWEAGAASARHAAREGVGGDGAAWAAYERNIGGDPVPARWYHPGTALALHPSTIRVLP